jgi:hypothetical protein
MFAHRMAGQNSGARITRALNDAGIPCPSAATHAAIADEFWLDVDGS